MVTISSNSTTTTILNVQTILDSTSTYTVAATGASSICSTMTPLTNVLTSLANKTSNSKCLFQTPDRNVSPKRKGAAQPSLPVLTPPPILKTKLLATMPLNKLADSSSERHWVTID